MQWPDLITWAGESQYHKLITLAHHTTSLACKNVLAWPQKSSTRLAKLVLTGYSKAYCKKYFKNSKSNALICLLRFVCLLIKTNYEFTRIFSIFFLNSFLEFAELTKKIKHEKTKEKSGTQMRSWKARDRQIAWIRILFQVVASIVCPKLLNLGKFE